MAEAECQSKHNGFSVSDDDPHLISIERMEKEETLYGVLNRIVAAIFFPDLDASSLSLFQRLRCAFADNHHSLKQASKNSSRKLIRWTRRGGPLRSLLVISVGMITLVALTGIIVFMLFFLATTANAIIISLLISMAAAGGFLAMFFACLTGIYIVAISVAVFVISVATISTVIAIMIATGWIGFFWIVWLSVTKSLGFTKHSLAMTGSAISAYSAALHAHRHRHTE